MTVGGTMQTVTIYRTRNCPYCHLAAQLLARKGVNNPDVIAVDSDDALRDEMVQRSGRRSVPQIFISETHIGGYEDLAALDRAGRLDPLLNGTQAA